MTMRNFLSLLLIVSLPLFCASCLVLDWPALPAATYHGHVVDEAGRPVAGVEVVFYRMGQLASYGPGGPYDDTEQEIAKAYSGKDGTFQATTSGGYATKAYARSPHRYGVVGDVQYKPRSPALPHHLEIKLERY